MYKSKYFNESLEQTTRPKVDMEEKENEIVVTMDIPGTLLEDIDVSLNNRLLSVNTKKGQKNKNYKYSYINERVNGPYSRSIYLPINASLLNITCTYINGVLTIRTPINSTSTSKKITVLAK